ncbi:hypothetical protein [Streptomyces sp. 021-4]|uniref:hypothetical protein n=1 Tax=Streptomyces sp. 021-4 TaxID=2789260 RepID=UPI0039F635C9
MGGLAGVAALAALAAWALWPAADPAVAVPDRVCDDSLPGTLVSALLPERGEPFEEERFAYFGSRDVSAPGKCYLSGGGTRLGISYQHILSPEDFSPQDIERSASGPGNRAVSLGSARGYADSHSVSLFTSCRGEAGRETLVEVKTSVGSSGGDALKDEATLAKAAALTAETARSVTPRMNSCTAPPVPEGEPALG